MFKSEDTRRGTYGPAITSTISGLSPAQPPPQPVQPGPVQPPPQPVQPVQPDQIPAIVQSEFEEFKDTVRLFVASDREISKLAAQLKQLRADNASRREAICKFMGDRDIEDLHTREMRLKLKTAQVKPPLKKAELHERVAAFLGGEDKAADFFEKVYNDRESVERTSLCRLKVKGQ